MKGLLLFCMLGLLWMNAGHAQSYNSTRTISQADYERAMKLMDEGVSLFDNGQYEASIGKYRQAYALDTSYHVARYEIALALEVLTRYPEALAVLDSTPKASFDRDPNCWHLRATILTYLRRYPEAQQTVAEGIRRYPTNPFILTNGAQAFLKSGQRQQGYDQLFRSLEAVRGFPYTYNALSEASAQDHRAALHLMMVSIQILLVPAEDQKTKEELLRNLETLLKEAQKPSTGKNPAALPPSETERKALQNVLRLAEKDTTLGKALPPEEALLFRLFLHLSDVATDLSKDPYLSKKPGFMELCRLYQQFAEYRVAHTFAHFLLQSRSRLHAQRLTEGPTDARRLKFILDQYFR